MIALAGTRGVFVAGISQAPEHSASSDESDTKPLGWLGSVAIDARAMPDIHRGTGILAACSKFATGTAAIIDRGRVIAVGTSESPIAVIERVASFRKSDRRRGVIVVAPSQKLDEALLRTAAKYKFAGVAKLGETMSTAIDGATVRLVDDLGLFICETGAPARV